LPTTRALDAFGDVSRRDRASPFRLCNPRLLSPHDLITLLEILGERVDEIAFATCCVHRQAGTRYQEAIVPWRRVQVPLWSCWSSLLACVPRKYRARSGGRLVPNASRPPRFYGTAVINRCWLAAHRRPVPPWPPRCLAGSVRSGGRTAPLKVQPAARYREVSCHRQALRNLK
jgi:hypothetical protein